MSLQYNQFGQLDDSIICNYRPFIGECEGTTIEEAFEDVADYYSLPSVFHDTFYHYEGSEEINEEAIEDMIDFFDFCDFSVSDFETCGEAFDSLYDFAREEQADAEKELANAEQSAIDLFIERMENLDVDVEIRDTLINNLRTKGTASTAYLDAVEEGDENEQATLLERMDIANWRHKETNYDELRQVVDRKTARLMFK